MGSSKGWRRRWRCDRRWRRRPASALAWRGGFLGAAGAFVLLRRVLLGRRLAWPRAASARPARMRAVPQHQAAPPASLSAAGVSSGALRLFPNAAACACANRLLGIDQRRLGAARIGPDEIADQHEIRAGRGEFGRLPRARRQSRRRAARTIRPTIAAARRSPPSRAARRRHRVRRTARSRRRARLRPSNRAASQARRRRRCDRASATAAPPPARRCRSDARHRRRRAPPVRHGRRAAAPRRHSGSPAPAP